jgi:protein ImuA
MNNFPDQISGDSGATRGFAAVLRDRAVHELRAPAGTAAHLAFAARRLAAMPSGVPVLWISPTQATYPPGLAWLGLEPGRCVFAQARHDAECLGALEVALRGGMAGVGECAAVSRLAARRLALAAKDGGGTGFLLRTAPAWTAADSNAFATRWLITPAPGGRLRAELLYAKGGQKAVFYLNMEGENETADALTLVSANPGGLVRRTG